MTADKRQPAAPNDPREGLKPWVIAGALSAAAAAWLVVELIERFL